MLRLTGKGESAGFDQIASDVTAKLNAIAAERATLRSLGPDADDRHEAVQTLQNLRVELPYCLPEYHVQFLHARAVVIVAETSIAMAYSLKVAAVLGSARFLPKASVFSDPLTSGLFRSPRIIGYGPREVSVHLPGCRVPVPRPLCIHILGRFIVA